MSSTCSVTLLQINLACHVMLHTLHANTSFGVDLLLSGIDVRTDYFVKISTKITVANMQPVSLKKCSPVGVYLK